MNPIKNIIKKIEYILAIDVENECVKTLSDEDYDAYKLENDGYNAALKGCITLCTEELKTVTGIYYEPLNPKKGTRYKDLIPLANAGKLFYQFHDAMQKVAIESGNGNLQPYDFICNRKGNFFKSIHSINNLIGTDRMRYFIKVDMNE